MYYLFIHKQSDIEAYKNDFNRVSENIKAGKTPVFSEMRCAKTNLIESVPYNILNGVFLIVGTILLQKLKLNSILSVAVVLVINSMCGALANFIFTCVKHWLRIRLCKRLGIEANEHNIAVMESLEYQTV